MENYFDGAFEQPETETKCTYPDCGCPHFMC